MVSALITPKIVLLRSYANAHLRGPCVSGAAASTKGAAHLLQSHFGGLTCCAWSHDSHYIVTGGEDDLVCVYGLTEQAVVFWGQGHQSWITRVSFDRWYPPPPPPQAP